MAWTFLDISKAGVCENRAPIVYVASLAGTCPNIKHILIASSGSETKDRKVVVLVTRSKLFSTL